LTPPVEPGLVEIALPYRPELTQQHGYFHGGIVSTIADSAGGYAAYTLFPADSSILTVEYKISVPRTCALGLQPLICLEGRPDTGEN